MMHRRHEDRGSIYSATIGVLFLGTPHRGSSKEGFGQLVALAAKATFHDPNMQLLGTLAENSHILEKQRDEFVTISKDLEVVCFYEELPMSIGMVCESNPSHGSDSLIGLRQRLSHKPRLCMMGKGSEGWPFTLHIVTWAGSRVGIMLDTSELLLRCAGLSTTSRRGLR